MKISQIISTQNCLQFDTMTVIFDKRIKSQWISEEEHDFTIVMQHILHEGTDILNDVSFP